MDKKSTIIIAVIFIVALIGFVVISFQKTTLDTDSVKSDLASTTEWVNTPATPSPETTTPKTVITAKHAYRNGEHIIVGELPLPTPCHILETKGIASADKKHVFTEFVSSIKTGETCVQTITPARFRITVKGDKGAVMSATLNGKEVTLNLIEAGPTEDLDNFELYIKG